jgi:hypothetical protein
VFYAAIWLALLYITLTRREKGNYYRIPKVAVVLGIAITATVMAVLADIPWDERLYLSTVVYDHGFRSAVVDALSRSQYLPPANPFFFPGHAAPFQYHYFWFMICSLVEQLGKSFLDGRAALVGSVVWAALALLATVAVTVRFLEGKTGEAAKRRALLVGAAAAISGLDVLPLLYDAIARAFAGNRELVTYGSIDWWNAGGQITSWPSSVIWVPNHVASVVAGMVSVFLLWEGRKPQPAGARTILAIFAGVAIASGAGLSVLIAFSFGVLFLLFLVVSLVRMDWPTLKILAVALMIAGAALSPYAMELGTAGSAGNGFLVTGIRPFSWTETVIAAGRVTSASAKFVISLLMLPLNYFMELGALFIVAVWKLRRLGTNRNTDQRQEGLFAAMLVVSVVVGSFLRMPRADDLGWRC